MQSGVVKWFDERKNYGFLSSKGQDFFVHGSEVQGKNPLKEGDKVSFEAIETERGKKAIKVKSL